MGEVTRLRLDLLGPNPGGHWHEPEEAADDGGRRRRGPRAAPGQVRLLPPGPGLKGVVGVVTDREQRGSARQPRALQQMVVAHGLAGDGARPTRTHLHGCRVVDLQHVAPRGVVACTKSTDRMARHQQDATTQRRKSPGPRRSLSHPVSAAWPRAECTRRGPAEAAPSGTHTVSSSRARRRRGQCRRRTAAAPAKKNKKKHK